MSSSIFFIAFLIAFSYPSSSLCDDTNLQTYIVHVRRSENADGSNDGLDLETWHRSFLPKITTLDSEERNSDPLVYSYGEVFSGFAARLTETELEAMSKKQGFVRAYPNRIVPLLTTHTPDFLNLRGAKRLWNRSNLGKGVIIGVLDTGILPGHPSFNDQGVPPPPAKWKVQCEFKDKKGCNNKVIGARVFKKFSGSNVTDPSDDVGHGSHTASTIAGNFVINVDAFGLGKGVAAGMAPHAHLAIYKVCDREGCSDADILAGLDSAARDGVDVLSLSIGGLSRAYDEDPIAIGAFGAIQKGIVVVCSGGNNGPSGSSVSNDAPWILTVAASTIDRKFRSTVKLGNGQEYNGEALFQPANFSSVPVPLVYIPGCFPLKNVRGKIVICDTSEAAPAVIANFVRAAGGPAVILVTPQEQGYTSMLENFYLASSTVPFYDGLKIKTYASSSNNSTASIIFHGSVLGTSPAPVVAFFSSRGPSQRSPGILKPDITAPGVNILAAWNTKVDASSKSKIPFNIMSGTSMAAPHVSGVAALIKSLHPDWSPAAIKSAIITSSDNLDRQGNTLKDEQYHNASFFSSGAGHLSPTKAADPGLVYDLNIADYVAYLCGTVGERGISTIVRGANASCKNVKNITDSELNYPTITISLSSRVTTVNRTVTNVGTTTAKYTVEVDAPKGVSVTVKPATLQFSKVNKKLTFSVSVRGNSPGEGNLKWISGKTVVRSALVITK